MRDWLLVVAVVMVALGWVGLLVLWCQVLASRARLDVLHARSERLVADQLLLAAEAERLRRALNGDPDA